MAGLRGRGSRPDGGEGGPTTALIRGQREAEGDSPTPWAADPAPSYPARSNPEGWGVGPRPSTREVEASDAASASRGGTASVVEIVDKSLQVMPPPSADEARAKYERANPGLASSERLAG